MDRIKQKGDQIQRNLLIYIYVCVYIIQGIIGYKTQIVFLPGASAEREAMPVCGFQCFVAFFSVFGLLICNRFSIGCGIVIGPGCFPQKFGAFFCYNHSPLTCGSLMPFTLDLWQW